MYGTNNLVWPGVQNATTGTVYVKQYGFSTNGVAAAYVGALIGSVIGGYYCGKIGRQLTLRLARRNGGVSESEHTLYMFIASMVLVPAGMLLYGLGVVHNIHWIGLIFSQGMIAASSTLAPAGALGYAISSYPELSGDMVTTCILIRNTLSFAINYGYDMRMHARLVTSKLIGTQHNAVAHECRLPEHVHHRRLPGICVQRFLPACGLDWERSSSAKRSPVPQSRGKQRSRLPLRLLRQC